jgi:ankyrin repeat protein
MHRMKWVPKAKPAELTEQKEKKKDPVRILEPSPPSQPKPRHKHHKQSKKTPKKDPLYAAVIADQPDQIKSLIRHGADPNKCYGFMGSTPLHSAAMQNKKQAALALIEMKANVNANPAASSGTPVFGSRGTPLHVAAGARQIEMIDILLKAEAKVNLQDAMGDTALHKAVYGSYNGSHKATIEKLLQAGADPKIKNKQGLTPAVVAIHWKEPDIAALLVNDPGLTPGVSGRPKGRVQAALALNLPALAAVYISG